MQTSAEQMMVDKTIKQRCHETFVEIRGTVEIILLVLAMMVCMWIDGVAEWFEKKTIVSSVRRWVSQNQTIAYIIAMDAVAVGTLVFLYYLQP